MSGQQLRALVVGSRLLAGGDRLLTVVLGVTLLAACASAPGVERSSVQVLGRWTGSEADVFQELLPATQCPGGVTI